MHFLDFSPEDRVMLIGITNCPWESDQKLLQQVYQKYLTIPRPDYTSRYNIWSHFLGQYSAISWHFDTSAMTKISDGYTTGNQPLNLNTPNCFGFRCNHQHHTGSNDSEKNATAASAPFELPRIGQCALQKNPCL